MKLPNQATKVITSKKTRWIISGFVVFLLLIAFALPPLVRSITIDKLQQTLGRPVTIEAIHINPLTLSLSVEGFAIKETQGNIDLLAFKQLYLNLESLSLFKGGPVLREIRLTQPRINLARIDTEHYNFSDILQRLAAQKTPEQPKKESKPALFSLNNIQIIDGAISFGDQPKGTQHKIEKLNIVIPFVSNLPYYLEEDVQPRFAALVNGTPLELKGKTRPFASSRSTNFDIELEKLDIPFYLAYLPTKFHFTIPSGQLDAKASLSFVQYEDQNRPPQINLSAQAKANNIAVNDTHNQPLLKLANAQVNLREGDVVGKRFLLGNITLESPQVFLLRDKQGKLNVANLVDKDEEESTTVVEIDQINLNHGQLTYADQFTKQSFKTQLDNISAKVSHFSNAPTKQTAISLSLDTESGETLRHDGQLTLKPNIIAAGQLALEKVRINKYAAYYQQGLLFTFQDGKLNATADYAFQMKDQGFDAVIKNLGASLDSLSLQQQGQRKPFLTLPALDITNTQIDLNRHTVDIGQLTTRDGKIQINREKDGTLNLTKLTTAGKEKAQAKSEPAKPADVPWTVNLTKLALNQYSVSWLDKLPEKPVLLTATAINLTAQHFSTSPKNRTDATLALTLNKRGKLTAKGGLSLAPFTSKLDVTLKGIDLMPFQPYFTDKIKIVVSRGALSTQGQLGITAGEELKLAYNGNANLSDLSTMDKATLTPFLNWNSLFMNGIRFDLEPFRLAIKEIALTDFYSRLQIHPDGSINLQDIVVKKDVAATTAATSPATEKTTPPPPVTIDRVTLQGGEVDFSDQFIKPNYFASLNELAGRITGLSSDPEVRADVDLRGKFEHYAPLAITGKINPLSKDLFADLKTEIKDFDLSPLTPYSGKFAGYTIQKGKLSLNLKYLIEQRKLEAQNNVFLDQFAFGETVESPDAVNLPFNLAVVLLKNRKGEIDIKLPVEGTLDDPEFRFGRVAWQVVKNLIVKIVTSPFALLGSLVGGGEELSFVDFDPGSNLLSEANRSKLHNLEKALYDRPALNIEITGHIDPERDKDGLRQHDFMLKLKRQKYNELLNKGTAPATADEVEISQEEYPRHLKLAYDKESFPKPRTGFGLAKDLPVVEMEKLMLAYTPVTEEDLRKLAITRGMAVMDELLKSGQIEPGRIFLIEPKTLAPEAKENLRNSRVDFAIK